MANGESDVLENDKHSVQPAAAGVGSVGMAGAAANVSSVVHDCDKNKSETQLRHEFEVAKAEFEKLGLKENLPPIDINSSASDIANARDIALAAISAKQGADLQQAMMATVVGGACAVAAISGGGALLGGLAAGSDKAANDSEIAQNNSEKIVPIMLRDVMPNKGYEKILAAAGAAEYAALASQEHYRGDLGTLSPALPFDKFPVIEKSTGMASMSRTA